jgi:O-antigen/teichoic acid export membrane protein
MVGLFIAEFVPAILSYLFLLILSNSASTDLIGVLGFVITLSAILANISSLEIHVGMKRFLGKSISENDWSNFKQISSTSVLFVLLTSVSILLLFVTPFVNFSTLLGVDDSFIPIIVIIVIGSNLQKVFTAIFSSALKSSSLIFPSVLASSLRFPPLLFFIFQNDLTEINVLWSYAIFYAVIAISTLILITLLFFRQDGISIKNIFLNIKLVLKGSLSNWINSVIGILGTKLNLLVVFSTHGASDAGLFFIPFVIFGILMMLVNSITQIIHPVFSGFKDPNQELFVLKRTLKLGFLTTIPLCSVVFFYAESILSIFSNQFVISNDVLSILLISFPLMVFDGILFYLFYARGKYAYIFYIGIITNIPRILLYFVLIPELGNIGAAWAYTIGAIVQTGITLFFIKKSNISLQYLQYFGLVLIPFSLGFIFEQINLGLFGAVLVFIFSYIIFFKLKLFSEDDIENYLQIFSSKEIIIKRKNKIINFLKYCKLY